MFIKLLIFLYENLFYPTDWHEISKMNLVICEQNKPQIEKPDE